MEHELAPFPSPCHYQAKRSQDKNRDGHGLYHPYHDLRGMARGKLIHRQVSLWSSRGPQRQEMEAEQVGHFTHMRLYPQPCVMLIIRILSYFTFSLTAEIVPHYFRMSQ